jgi:ABC-2 type transport system permease protein
MNLPMQNPRVTAPSRPGRRNWLGLWTLYVREVRRFYKVVSQTIVAPVITGLLFLAIFSLALGGGMQALVAGVPFLEFLVPGLIMMTMVQNAFANTSSSLIISKIQGNIVDVLTPPLSPGELTAGFVLGGATRGLIVGLAVGLGMFAFVPMRIASLPHILFHAAAASLMLSLLGVLAGLWAEKFDQLGAFTNFIVTPLAFLSGTFYSVDRLPEPWQLLAHLNPFFYMIDGFRYGFIGHADGNLQVGILLMGGGNLALWALCHALFRSGYKLKA